MAQKTTVKANIKAGTKVTRKPSKPGQKNISAIGTKVKKKAQSVKNALSGRK